MEISRLSHSFYFYCFDMVIKLTYVLHIPLKRLEKKVNITVLWDFIVYLIFKKRSFSGDYYYYFLRMNALQSVEIT